MKNTSNQLNNELVQTSGSSPNSRKRSDYFSSIEHKAIGDIAFKDFLEKSMSSSVLSKLKKDKLLVNHNALNVFASKPLTPGDIIALGGDFYGAKEAKPISFAADEKEQETRFLEAYNALATANLKEVNRFLKGIKEEKETVIKSINQIVNAIDDNDIKSQLDPSMALDQIGKFPDINPNIKYGFFTRHHTISVNFLNSQYFDLLNNNFDHFAEQAEVAYAAGHRVAIDTAKQAGNCPEGAEKYKLLAKAFAQELFACHFLTDLFAAGHIRTPRKEIYDYVDQYNLPAKLKVAGLFAKYMHDEDNEIGLQVVSSKHPKGWKSFGDNCYFDKENWENVEYCQEAVIASLTEIRDASRNLKANNNYESYKEYIPKVDQNNENPPLFKVTHDHQGKKVLLVRKEEQLSNTEANYEDPGHPSWLLTKFNIRAKRKAVNKDNILSQSDREQWMKLLNDLEAEDKKDSSIKEQESELQIIDAETYKPQYNEDKFEELEETPGHVSCLIM